MKLNGFFVAVLLACTGVQASELTITGSTAATDSPRRSAPTTDTAIVTLPGAPASVAEPSRPASPPQATPKPSKRVLPPDFQRDTALYLQQRIGQWKLSEALGLLGAPLHHRAASGDKGEVFAFSDPTGRYRQLELEFNSQSGDLQTVFLYPGTLKWSDCVRIWGSEVNSARAGKGRTFYSYLNRNLDVLVDPVGKVISLGLY